MSYSIEVAQIAAEKIRRFRPDVSQEVVEELDRLGRDPSLGICIPTGPLEGRMAFTFRVARPPGAWRVTVLYQFTQDEGAIHSYDFGFLRGDPPRLEEAAPAY